MNEVGVIFERAFARVEFRLVGAPEVQALYHRTPAGVMIDPDYAEITTHSEHYAHVVVTGNRVLRTGERGKSRVSMSWTYSLNDRNGGGAPMWIQKLVREYAPLAPEVPGGVGKRVDP